MFKLTFKTVLNIGKLPRDGPFLMSHDYFTVYGR